MCYVFVSGLALLIAGGVEYRKTPIPTPEGSDTGEGTFIAGGVILFVGLLFAG